MALYRLGGIAALFEAAVYIFGFVVFLGVLGGTGLDTDAARLAYLAETKALTQFANIIIYVAFGAALVVLVTALHTRLQAASPALSKVAAAFGVIWAGIVITSGMVANIGIDMVLTASEASTERAMAIWQSTTVVQEGLGGGVEVVGGLWLLLLSIAGWRGAQLSKGLHALGMVIGACGVLTLIPAISEIGAAVFGLGQILWFLWVGVALLRIPDIPQAA